MQGTKLLVKNLVSHINLKQATCSDLEGSPSSPSSHAHSVPPNIFSSNTQTLIPNKRGFKMACLNITSLRRHIDELRIILHSKCLDLLAVNETRSHEIIADNEVSIDGYDIVRRDRPLNGRNGGGVCFNVRSNINYNVRKELVFDQLENLIIEISKPRSKSFIVATWYRPPNSPFELLSDFESYIGKLDAEGKEYYLMGDLNCNMLSSSLNNANTQALINITDIYNQKQLIYCHFINLIAIRREEK